MRYQLFAITLLAVILALSHAKLSVRSPSKLSDKFDKIRGIDYTVLTPGNKLTYKRRFNGNLILADPKHACENITAIASSEENGLNPPILVAEWGDCHYAQKVKNAEVAGAKMLLLVLKHDMQLNHPSVRQLPMNTNIEVLAIGKEDGDKLISYLLDAKEMKATDPNSIVEVTYSVDEVRHVNFVPGENVIIDFWFSASDPTHASYEVLENIREILAGFGDRVEFHPYYVLWQCEECAANNFNKVEPRCLGGGRYCDPEPIQENTIAGAQGVIEDLRQICFRESAGRVTIDSDWWKYVSAFNERCLDSKPSEMQACRDKIYNDGTVNSKTATAAESCIQKSFKNKDASKPVEENLSESEHLKKEWELREKLHIDHYPSLYINKERYGESFRNKMLIQQTICSRFVANNLPDVCGREVHAGPPEHTHSDILIYIGIISISVALMACMLYCVRRTVKRQVMVRMNDEISHIVTQYKQFKDKSSSFSQDEDDL